MIPEAPENPKGSESFYEFPQIPTNARVLALSIILARSPGG